MTAAEPSLPGDLVPRRRDGVQVMGELPSLVAWAPGGRPVLLAGPDAVLWEVLEHEATIDELAEDLAETFELEPLVARLSVEDGVKRLADAHLLAAPEAEVPAQDISIFPFGHNH